MSSKLLKRLEPFDDEGLSGYVLKLTVINRVPPYYLLSKLEINEERKIQNYYYDSTNFSSNDIKLLSTLTNCETNTILRMQFDTLENNNPLHSHNKNAISELSLCTKKAKVCPQCLSEHEYFRKAWGLVNITVCPIHHIELVDRCSQCNELISWCKGNVFKCECGKSHKETKGNEAPIECVWLSKFIYSKFGYLSYEPNLINEEFSSLSLYEFDDIFFLLAKYLTGVRNPQQFASVNFSNSEYMQTQCEVVRIINSWPVGFHNFLDKIKLTTQNNKFTKLLGDFGKFYAEVARDRKHTLSLLKKEFIKYILLNTEQYLGSNFTRVVNQYEHFVLSGVKAASYLNISLSKLVNLVEHGVLEGTVLKSEVKKEVVVLKESADKYMNFKERWIRTPAVQKQFGIGERGLEDLINHKILDYQYEQFDNSGAKLFDRQSIEKIINDLRGKVVAHENINHEGMITFSKVINLGNDNCSTGKLVKLITEKKLQPRALGSEIGLESLLFDKEEVVVYFKSVNESKMLGYMTTKEVSLKFGTKEHTINFWAEIGLLNYSNLEKQYGKIFSREHIDQFRMDYLSIKEINSEFMLTGKISIQKLMKFGLIPVTGNQIDGGKKYLFKRSEIAEFFSRE